MFRFHHPPPLSLYVHLPWCVRKCPYCDFNSHALRGDAPFDAYVDALLRDAEAEASRAPGRPVETVFLGGGTPSLFPPETIARLLSGLRERIPFAADAEITLEANPGTVEQERFEGFREAGVNRLSIGAQSFSDRHLRRLGRIHGPREAHAAARACRDAGFAGRFNLDLMFGLPGQTTEEALEDVERALALDPPHLSYYQLTLEPGTAFHRRPPPLPEEDEILAMEERCHARLHAAGLARYEISAWSRPGGECRHNLNYWQFGDYLAVGAGAHGKVTDVERGRITRYAKTRLPRQFMHAAGTGEAVTGETPVTPENAVLEFMMNALRLTAGVPAELASERTGLPWAEFAAGIERGCAAGWLTADGGRIAPTERGLLFLNDLLGCFLPETA